jgi:hypothetical protein
MIELFKNILLIFDFSSFYRKRSHEIDEIMSQSDAQAIQSDWDAVGNDFRNVLGHHK